jgi:acetylornithine deacetylase
MKTIEILRDLVAIPSRSALSNVPVIDYAAKLLDAHGWYTERQAYMAADGAAKENLIAVPAQHRRALPEVDLAFVCHTDTVPYAWADALELTERDGMLHGCGSCDVKGSLACLLAAALSIDAAVLPQPVALILTADEEVGCLGATRLAASGIIRPRRAVICEPTSLRPATAGKGYGLAEVRVTGHEAHSAFPAKGVSALMVAAEMLLAVRELGVGETTEDSLFDPPHTTYNVGVLQGGTAKNIIPGECTFLVEWRSLPSEPAAAGGERVQRLGRDVAARNPEASIEVKIVRADAGFARPETSELGDVLSGLLGRKPTGISFGSEATRFSSLGAEVVVVGPGDMHTAHSERECVPIAELAEWTSAVRELMLKPVVG